MKIRSVGRTRLAKIAGVKKIPKGFSYWAEVRNKKGELVDGGWFKSKNEARDWVISTRRERLELGKVVVEGSD